MAFAEITRMLFAMNTILEQAASAAKLSKRAALALAIMYVEDNPGGIKTNQNLQHLFLEYRLSTGSSAKKDASAAKSELLAAEFIMIQGRMSAFAPTPKGQAAIAKMYQVMNEALGKLELSDDERSVLRKLVELTNPKPSASAKAPSSEKSAHRKPS